MFKHVLNLTQARRHRGAFRGRAPQITACTPQTRIVPPKRGLCPEEINKLGATEAQFEAGGSQNTGYHARIREQELAFRRFCNKDHLFLWLHPRIHESSRVVWNEDPFFLYLPQISSNFALNTNFFWSTLSNSKK